MRHSRLHAPLPCALATATAIVNVAPATRVHIVRRIVISPPAGIITLRYADWPSMIPSPIRIEPIPGYTPTIGRLVGMLTYARNTTIAAVEGLTIADLDHLHDAQSNSIGALLTHIAVVERSYQIMTFQERALSSEEKVRLSAALNLGDEGRRVLRGRSLDGYLIDLQSVRQVTLAGLASRDDEWLERSVVPAPKINVHWAWFHQAEDEINHRGQIRWLRARLPA